MNIAQITPNDPISQLAQQGLLRNSSLLRILDFYAVGGNADSVPQADASVDTNLTRALNTDNTSTPKTPVDLPLPKKIVSFDAAVDVTLEDRNIDANTELARRTLLEAEARSYILQTALIDGETTVGAPTMFNGIKALVPAANVLATGMLVPVGNADEKVSYQQTAIEALLSFMARVKGGAQYMLMNELMKVRFLTVAKALGYYRLSKDELGAELDVIGSTPIIGAGYKADGSLQMDFTGEGTSASILAFRLGEKVNLTAITSVGIKGRYIGQVGNLYKNNINLDINLLLQDSKVLWESTGWKIA